MIGKYAFIEDHEQRNLLMQAGFRDIVDTVKTYSDQSYLDAGVKWALLNNHEDLSMPCNALNLTTKIVISISSTTKLTSQELMALINNIYVIVVALDSKIDTPEPKPIVSLAA